MKSRYTQQEIYTLSAIRSTKNGVYTVFLLCLISGSTSAWADTQTQNKLESVQDFQKKASAASVTSALGQAQDHNNPASSAESSANAPVKMSTIILTAEERPGFDHIQSEQLARFKPISSADLLRGQSSLHLGDSRNGGAVDVNIRGVQGQSRVAVTVDGAQQSLDVYRGYAGMQNRSYIDPLLMSSVEIEKGPSSKAGGAIGGTVAMHTLGVDDVLREDANAGVRLSGDLGNNGKKPVRQPKNRMDGNSLDVTPSMHQGGLTSAHAHSGSVATAWRSAKVDLIAAYAEREQGNYYAGKHGRDRYKSQDAQGNEKNSVAKIYPEGSEVLNSSSATQSLLFKSILRPTADHRLSLSYMNIQSQYGDLMPSDIIRFSYANKQQYPLSHNRINSVVADYRYQPADQDLIQLDAKLWMTNTKTNQLSGAFESPKSLMYGNNSDRGWSPLENNRYAAELSNTSKFNNTWGDFSLTVGGAVKQERLKPQSQVNITEADRQNNKVLRDAERDEYSLAVNFDYQPTDTLRFWTGLSYSENQAKDHNKKSIPVIQMREVKQLSVYDDKNNYGTMYWFPDENGQFTAATDPRLNNGVVFADSNNPFDGVHFNQLSKQVSVSEGEVETFDVVSGFKQLPSPQQKHHGLAPQVGVEYQFSPYAQVYASYKAQNRLPSLLETSMGTHQVEPGTTLKPEQTQSWEAGIVLDNHQGLTTRLNYFNNSIEHFINRYFIPNTFGMMTFKNMDHFKNSGIELQSNYDQGHFFANLSATKYLKIQSCDASYARLLRDTADSYNNTYDTPDCTEGGFKGSYLNTQNPPKFSSNLTVGTRLLDQRLVLGSRYTYSSGPMSILDRPWQVSSSTPQMKYESVHLIDVFADYKLNKNIAMNLSLQNLTNRYYLDPLSLSYMPAPGRSLNLGLKVYL